MNNRDRTKLVDGVLRQVDVVRDVLGEGFTDVEVIGCVRLSGSGLQGDDGDEVVQA